MRPMTDKEIRSFLLHGTRTGKLATIRADGRPHIAPIWFVLDGDALVFTTWHTTVKAANLRRDNRVSICVDDEAPPFAFAVVEGSAQFVDDMGELRRWATRIAARYMGAELAESYGARNGVPGELLVRVTPTRIVAQMEVAE